MISRASRLAVTLLILASGAVAGASIQKAPINTSGGEVALKGYDVISYLTGTPAKGSPEFTHRWDGATWQFSSAKNRDRFARAPEKYAPQFGGYCAWAVSRGYTADVDPEAFRVVDGRLYLIYSKSVQLRWEQDVEGNIAKASANWPAVLNK
jgi:YHS domain-containing protein